MPDMMPTPRILRIFSLLIVTPLGLIIIDFFAMVYLSIGLPFWLQVNAGASTSPVFFRFCRL